MKKIKSIVVITAVITTLIGCMKDKANVNAPSVKQNAPNNSSQVEGNRSELSSKANYYSWRKSDEEILAEKNLWLSSINKNKLAPKGQCGTHLSEHATLIAINRDCQNNITSMTYRFWSNDIQTASWCETTQSATFSNGIVTTNATLVYSNVELIGGCTAWLWDGECESITTLDYEFNTLNSGPWAPGSILGQLSVQFYLGNANTCPLNSFTYQVQGGFTGPQYQASPARIYVDANYFGGVFYPKTDCDLLCPSPQVICPGGGTLTYWPVGSPSSTTTLTLQTAGNTFSSLAPGNYEYSCVLWYTIGGTTYTSQPQTGSFTIN